MMSKRSGIPRGIAQCHSGGIASQNQNWSQKKSISSSPRFCDLRVALYSKANDAQRQGKPLSAGSSDLFFVAPLHFISNLGDDAGARGFL
jgi:hypothetical protein